MIEGSGGLGPELRRDRWFVRPSARPSLKQDRPHWELAAGPAGCRLSIRRFKAASAAPRPVLRVCPRERSPGHAAWRPVLGGAREHMERGTAPQYRAARRVLRWLWCLITLSWPSRSTSPCTLTEAYSDGRY